MTTRPKAPTMKEVARIAGVSVATVSNVINDTKAVSAETAIRVREAMASSQFVPNRLVRTLRGDGLGAIALLIPDSANPHFIEVARGVEDVVKETRQFLIYCNTTGARNIEQELINRLAEMRVSGVMIDSTNDEPLDVTPIATIGAPLVVLGGAFEGWGARITVDHAQGMRLAAAHLRELGHRHVVFAAEPGAGPVIETRYRTLKDEYDGHGVGRISRADARGRSAADRAALAQTILETWPQTTAVVCANDVIALALETALLRLGVRVPTDISLVGFDDIPASDVAVVRLTTVRASGYAIGQMAGSFLLDGRSIPLEPFREESIEPSLIVRESTGPAGTNPSLARQTTH